VNRRTFIVSGGLAFGGVLGVGVLWENSSLHAQQKELNTGLLADALPRLNNKAAGETKDLPVKAREQLRTFFDCACLNSQSFISRVYSRDSRTR
jgi:hypothetical protein